MAGKKILTQFALPVGSTSGTVGNGTAEDESTASQVLATGGASGSMYWKDVINDNSASTQTQAWSAYQITNKLAEYTPLTTYQQHGHGASTIGGLTEAVQDIVGGMFTGNTETNITATYQDDDGTIDLVADAGSGSGTVSSSETTDSDGDLQLAVYSASTTTKKAQDLVYNDSSNDFFIDCEVNIANGVASQTSATYPLFVDGGIKFTDELNSFPFYQLGGAVAWQLKHLSATRTMLGMSSVSRRLLHSH